MAYLGIDLGTSGLRVLLTDSSGEPVTSAEAHYPVSTPHPGWSEQEPAHWIGALDKAMEALRSKTPLLQDLKGIGVAGHMHGAVLLDENDAVLRPCILWNDSRSHAEATLLDKNPVFRAQSGNIVFPGFTAPKLEWVRKHEPDLHARIAKVLLPAAFLNLYLTGEPVGDISDAAGTSWLDVGAREWSAELLRTGHVRTEQMAQLVEGCAPAGVLRAELQENWRLKNTVTVAGGAADNAAAACGMGVLRQGQGFVSLGTSGVVLAARDSYQPCADMAVHSFCHAVPETWYQMGVMLSATDSLNWLSRILDQSPRELTDALGKTPDQPADTLFLPYLSGERTPHNDTAVRGGFAGLAQATSRNDLTRAVLQGVAFGLRDCLDAIGAGGQKPDALFAIGGGSASDYWLKVLATVFDTPLYRPIGGEFGAALGAARLSQIAATGCDPADVIVAPKNLQRFEPDAALVPAYADAHARFRAAYPVWKSLPE